MTLASRCRDSAPPAGSRTYPAGLISLGPDVSWPASSRWATAERRANAWLISGRPILTSKARAARIVWLISCAVVTGPRRRDRGYRRGDASDGPGADIAH